MMTHASGPYVHDIAVEAPPTRVGRFAPPHGGPLRLLREQLARRALRAAMHLFNHLIPAAGGPRRSRLPADSQGLTILLTGAFHAVGWIEAHLRPLADSPFCQRVCIVSNSPIPPMPKVVAICPPRWMVRLLGAAPARLLVFIAQALRRRPHVIGGFHLLVNSLLASALARVVRGRSLYFCVGGPLEVMDGGIWAENRLFALAGPPDAVLERQLIRSVGSFDGVIAMGRGAVRFFKDHRVPVRFHVIPGGMDGDRFHPATRPPETDLILVARLADIKRIDVFLQAVALASRHRPDLTAVIVGDGPLRSILRRMAVRLGLASRVRFVGARSNVSDWLRKARLFVLTSDSEGLALSVMEALMCGLPAIVSDVGDLGDVVEDGVTGYRVPRRDAAGFAARIVELLDDPLRRQAMSMAARQRAAAFELAPTTHAWNTILMEWTRSRGASRAPRYCERPRERRPDGPAAGGTCGNNRLHIA